MAIVQLHIKTLKLMIYDPSSLANSYAESVSGPVFPITPYVLTPPPPYIFPNLPYMPYILVNFIRLVGKTSMKLTLIILNLNLLGATRPLVPTSSSIYAKMPYLN